MLLNIQVFIWDFDGTLYKPNPDLWKEVRESEYRVISDHTGWEKGRVVDEFSKLHKKVLPSATETVASLCSITTAQAAVEMEKYYDRRTFLARDERLIVLFSRLTIYRHFILANGVKKRIEEALDVLGILPQRFEAIVTSELVGENKPHDAGFRYILGKTNLPAEQHLMVGDREQIDLLPANQLGMKTCLVWSDKKSDIADVTLPTVYDVVRLF